MNRTKHGFEERVPNDNNYFLNRTTVFVSIETLTGLTMIKVMKKESTVDAA